MERKEHARYDVIGSPQTKILGARDEQVTPVNWKLAHPVDKNHIIWNVIARRRAGKTTLLLNTLEGLYRGHFTSIYLFSPTAKHDDKMEDLVNLCRETSTYYDTIDKNTVPTVIERIMHEIEEWKRIRVTNPNVVEPKNLLIFDDCLQFFSDRSPSGSLAMLYNRSAHLKLSIWSFAQQISGIVPSARKGCDMMSIFYVANAEEFNTIKSEVSVPPDTFMKAYSQVHEDDQDEDSVKFLHIHWIKRGEPTLFDCYNRLDIPATDLRLIRMKPSDGPHTKDMKTSSKFDDSGRYKTIYDRSA